MKGLLLKDFIVLKKHALFMIVLVALFAMIPNDSMRMFSVVYASMLPMYAISYDERAKWDRTAATMPYGRKTVVISRYLLALLALIAVLALAALSGWVAGLITLNAFNPGMLLAMASTGFAFPTLVMPMLIKLGVEKGRMYYMLGLAVFVIMIGAFNAIAGDYGQGMIAMIGMQLSGGGLLALTAVVLALFALSARLSIGLYEKRAL